MSEFVTDEMVETAARAMWERLDREESWSEFYYAPVYRRDARAALEAVAPMIAAAALRQSMGWLRGYVGAVWDDGNAVGLDGWIGPGRGSDEVDAYAIRARERAIDRLQGHVDASADELEADREALGNE